MHSGTLNSVELIV